MQKISKLDRRTYAFPDKPRIQKSATNLKSDLGNPYQKKMENGRLPVTSQSGLSKQDSSKNRKSSTIDSAAKIYRIRANREVVQSRDGQLAEEEEVTSCDGTMCIGTSITKPMPPRAITLKYDRDVTTRSKPRQFGSIKSRAARAEGKEALQRQSFTQRATRDRVPGSASMAASVYSKHDVLASLRNLSLIEPFLSSKSNGILPLEREASLSLSRPVAFSYPNKRVDVTDPKNDANTCNASNSDSGICVDHANTENQDLNVNEAMISSHEPNDVFTTSPRDSYIPELHYRFEENGSNTDTSDNEAFVYRDAYNNKLFVTRESYTKTGNRSPLVAPASLHDVNKPTSKRQSRLTQRQLSHVGAAPPTATVVDISTGGVVERGADPSDTDDSAIGDHAQHLRSLAGSKTSVPASFCYNRKIKRRKHEDQTEMEALKKLKDKAREEIRTILKSSASDVIEESRHVEIRESPQRESRRTVEYAVVAIPSAQQGNFIRDNHLKSGSDLGGNPTLQRSLSSRSSSSTPSSTLSSGVKQPPTPNPSPQLESNRVQIFPTTIPNTFHAYTSASSKPTIINMDDFLQEQQKNEKSSKKPSTVSSRRATAGGGIRILITSDRTKRHASLNTTDALVKGHSLNVKSFNKSESETNNRDAHCDVTKPVAEESCNDQSEGEDAKVTSTSESEHDSSNFMSSGDESVIKQKSTLTKYTPLQSLVIKSCRSVNPIVVIPETTTNGHGLNTSILPQRTTQADLSPLKGIRILRRKITMQHYESNARVSRDKCEFPIFEPHVITYAKSSDDVKDSSYLETQGNKLSAGTKTGRISPVQVSVKHKEQTNEQVHVRQKSFPSFKVSHNFKPKTSNAFRRDSSDVTTATDDVATRFSINGPINIDKLCLGGEKGPPYLLLKEGGTQSLNFINPTRNGGLRYSLAPLRGRDGNEIPVKSAKRRRRVQLGSVGGSDNCVCVKISTGGGFKTNVAHYSLLLRQKQHRQDEQKQVIELDKPNYEVTKLSLQNHERDLSDRIPTRDVTIPDLQSDNERSSSDCDIIDERSPSVPIGELLSSLCKDSPPVYHAGGFPISGSPNYRRILNPQGSIDDEDIDDFGHRYNSLPSLATVNSNLNKDDVANSAAILPDSSTASYRLTHDVSFDEGSRYNNAGSALATFNSINEEQRISAGISPNRGRTNYHEGQSTSLPGNVRLDKLSESPNRDRHTSSGYPPSVTTHKETMPLSLIRIEERLNFESPHGRHPPSGFMVSPNPGSRGHSAQGGSHASGSAGGVTTFRFHKERQNWNYRMGDLSVNGGGYYGSTPIQPGGRVDTSGLGSLSISPASNFTHKITQSRDKNGTSTKSRLSSRYGCRYDGGQTYVGLVNKDVGYTDPCIAAPPSFQQRLTELSILEAETIKYERNRKLKRKSKQEKDS